MTEPKVEELPQTELCEKPLVVEPSVKSKRSEKPTEKVLLAKISDLEKTRKSLLNTAGNVKEQIYELMSKNGSDD